MANTAKSLIRAMALFVPHEGGRDEQHERQGERHLDERRAAIMTTEREPCVLHDGSSHLSTAKMAPTAMAGAYANIWFRSCPRYAAMASAITPPPMAIPKN